MDSPDDKHEPGISVRELVLFAIFVWLASAFVIRESFPKEDWGIIGDMFGAVNALFSGLALAFVVYTVWLQRKDLELQRQMLQHSIEEMRRQTEAIRDDLKVSKETRDIQRSIAQQADLDKSPPKFTWNPAVKNGDRYTLEGTNEGGLLTVITVNSLIPSDLGAYSPQKKGKIGNQGKITISITRLGGRFEIIGKDSFDQFVTMKVSVNEHGIPLNE